MQPNRDSNMKTEIKLIANVPTGEGHIKIMPHFDKCIHCGRLMCCRIGSLILRMNTIKGKQYGELR